MESESEVGRESRTIRRSGPGYECEAAANPVPECRSITRPLLASLLLMTTTADIPHSISHTGFGGVFVTNSYIY